MENQKKHLEPSPVLLLVAWIYVVVLLLGVGLWLLCQPVHIVAELPTRIHPDSEFKRVWSSETATANATTGAEGEQRAQAAAFSIVAWPWQTINISAETPGIKSASIGVRSAGEAVFRRVSIPEGESTFAIHPSDRLQPLAQSFMRGSLFILLALVVICASYWIGLSVSCWLAGAGIDRAAQSEITALFVGFFGAALLFGSLAYFLSAGYIAVLAATLALICAIHVRGAIPCNVFGGMLPAFPGLIWSFWPVFLVGGDFLGLYQTDMFEYSTLVSFLQNHSLLGIQAIQDAQNSGLITSGAGFSWRSIDSVMAATLGSLFGIDSRAALTLNAMVFYLIYIITILLLLEILKAPKALKVLGVATVSLSPALNALYTAGYYSHFIFACVMPATIVMALPVNHLLLQNSLGNRSNWPAPAAWMLAVAVSMAVYPYFMVISLAGTAMFLLWHQRGRLRQVILFGLASATVVVITMNINCLSLFGYFKTKQFQGALDSLAIHTLMSGLTIQSFLHFLVAGRAYGARPLDISEFTESIFTSMPWLQAAYLDGAVAFYGYLTIGFVTYGIALWSARRSKAIQAIFCVAAVWVGVFLWFYSQDRHYIYLKAGWTGATILPLLSLALVKPGGIRPPLAMGLLVLLSVSWVTANAVDKFPYAANEHSTFSQRSHVGLLHDIKLIDESLRHYAETHAQGEVTYRYGDENLRGTDRDRVLFAHTRVVERGLGLTKKNAMGIVIPDEASPTAGVVITIGRDLNPLVDSDYALVAHGIHTSIYRREEK